jgi:hypothetical protein
MIQMTAEVNAEDFKNLSTRSALQQLANEMGDWFEQQGVDFWNKAREDFRKLYGIDSTPRTCADYVVATYGSDIIKATWQRLNTNVPLN